MDKNATDNPQTVCDKRYMAMQCTVVHWTWDGFTGNGLRVSSHMYQWRYQPSPVAVNELWQPRIATRSEGGPGRGREEIGKQTGLLLSEVAPCEGDTRSERVISPYQVLAISRSLPFNISK